MERREMFSIVIAKLRMLSLVCLESDLIYIGNELEDIIGMLSELGEGDAGEAGQELGFVS